MDNTTSAENYRKSKLAEINKIKKLDLDPDTKKSLVVKALKDILSDPKIQEAQVERKYERSAIISEKKEIERLKWEIKDLEEDEKWLERWTEREYQKERIRNQIQYKEAVISNLRIKIEIRKKYDIYFKSMSDNLDKRNMYLEKYASGGGMTTPDTFPAEIRRAKLLLGICQRRNQSDYQTIKEKIEKMETLSEEYQKNYYH